MDRRTFALLGTASLAACATTGAGAPALPSPDAIDNEALRLMATQDVKGMALAVIDRGQPVHVAAYGFANVERRQPLLTDTVMYGASITKAAFGYMVMQLVDEGRIDLDASIATYLPKPLPEYEEYTDLAGDERWRLLTPRICLNHRTGFHNFRWIEDDGKLRFHFTPGERYAYSGEGIWVLQRTLEWGLGLDVGREMQQRVFQPLGCVRTSMQWRPDFRPNLADGYGVDGAFEEHDERSNVAAAGSMDTTIADQALMWAGIIRGERLSARARAEYVRPAFGIHSAHQFPALVPDTDPRADAIALSAANGVLTFRDASGPMWFKGGHNDITGNMIIVQEHRQRALLLFSNSVRAELIYPDMTRFILGETNMPWWWEYNS